MKENNEEIKEDIDLKDMLIREQKNFSKEINGEIVFDSTNTKQKTTIVFDTKRSS